MNTKTISAIIVVIVLIALAYFFLGVKRTVPETATTGTSTEATTTIKGKMTASALAGARDPKMAGTWQATDDAKATRTFSMDGTVTDRYAGDASATDTGTWEVVDPTKEVIGVPAESVAGMTVLRMNFEHSGAFFYTVLSLTDNGLELSYLGRGNTLSYTKVK
ncbi:MAG: hypothetical protein JWM46_903 [Candidatus Kaiserbacteria bacterium]|nr:hypothetical protein [Candidatus Kaiserbacteria bacterium]